LRLQPIGKAPKSMAYLRSSFWIWTPWLSAARAECEVQYYEWSKQKTV